jgi:hypothetical protein
MDGVGMIMILESLPRTLQPACQGWLKIKWPSILHCVIVLYGYIEHIYMQKGDQIGLFICVSEVAKRAGEDEPP